jgi:hypothetical protein
MPPAGFKPTISVLDRAATGTTACLEQVFSFTISQHGDYWHSRDTLTGISLEANITVNSADFPAIVTASPVLLTLSR